MQQFIASNSRVLEFRYLCIFGLVRLFEHLRYARLVLKIRNWAFPTSAGAGPQPLGCCGADMWAAASKTAAGRTLQQDSVCWTLLFFIKICGRRPRTQAPLQHF